MASKGCLKENESPTKRRKATPPTIEADIRVQRATSKFRCCERVVKDVKLHEEFHKLDLELKDVEELNQVLTVKQRQCNDEINEARKVLIKAWKDVVGELSVIGVKRMGELDAKPFQVACYRKYFPSRVAEEESAKLVSLWESNLGNPEWHPFKIVNNGDISEEVVDDEDDKLRKLENDLGTEVYEAVCKALVELNEYNPSGGYVVEELWNFKEDRKASVKEAVTVLLRLCKPS